MTGNSFAFVDADGNNVSININEVYKVVTASSTQISFIFSSSSPQDRLTVTETLTNLEANTSGVFFQATYTNQKGEVVTDCLSVHRITEVLEGPGGVAVVKYRSMTDREETYILTQTYAAISASIDGASSGGSGSTNLTFIPNAVGFTIGSSSGTNAPVTGATGTLAGAKLPTPTLTQNNTAAADGANDLIEVWDASANDYRFMTLDDLLAIDDPQRYVVPAGAFADPENPTEAEVLTYIGGIGTAPAAGSVFTLVDGSSAKDGSTGNPEITWYYDGANVTRDKDISRKYEIPGAAFADTANPTRAEIITWLGSNSVNGNPVLLYLIGTGSEEEPQFVWMISTDGAVSPGDIVKIADSSATGTATTFQWYDVGIKTIKLKATANPTTWITETAIGTYTIVVPAGEELEHASFVVTTLGGASQNAPGGAINFVIDDSANNRNRTIGEASPVIAVGINVSAGQTYVLGTLNANAHIVATSFASNQMTVTLSGFPGQFADGSKITIGKFNGE